MESRLQRRRARAFARTSPLPSWPCPSRHYGENVAKIEIDQTFLDYEIADAGHTPKKHLITRAKASANVVFSWPPETGSGWDDQQVSPPQQFRDAGFGKAHCGAGPRSGMAW